MNFERRPNRRKCQRAVAGTAFLLGFSSMTPHQVWAVEPDHLAKDGKQVEAPPDILSNKPDAALTKEITSLIDRLNYPIYSERQKVTEELLEINAPALPQLRQTYRDAVDLEVKLRIEKIVQGIFFDYYVFNRNGFLGINMAPYSMIGEKTAHLPEGRTGMYVSNVIPKSAASRAGLVKGDVIIAVNDVPLVGDGKVLTEAFGALIRSHRPGETVNLSVVRGSETVIIPATLGRCPEETARQRRVTGTSDLYYTMRDRFPVWWASEFREGDVSSN